MNPQKPPKNDLTAEWNEVFQACQAGLRAFLRNRLSQEADVDDCLQAVSIKMLQSGHDVAPAARRAWLFRVAANESALLWRRKATTDRVLEKQATYATETVSDSASEKLELTESTDKVRQLIAGLPEETQQIIHMRIHQDRTFQEIADALNIPLGTALTRMRRGLERIRKEIESEE